MIHHYSLISLTVFGFYLVKFSLDTSTDKNDFTSWLTLALTLIFWPVLLPISGWELTKKFFHS
jgi:NADH:ubiquinone oxidoreductase subunit 6 (subunit J)